MNQNQFFQNSQDYKPQTIQLFFDGLEVVRIEDGQKVHEMLIPAALEPDLIEMYWDGELVYSIALKSGEVQVNRLSS